MALGGYLPTIGPAFHRAGWSGGHRGHLFHEKETHSSNKTGVSQSNPDAPCREYLPTCPLNVAIFHLM